MSIIDRAGLNRAAFLALAALLSPVAVPPAFAQMAGMVMDQPARPAAGSPATPRAGAAMPGASTAPGTAMPGPAAVPGASPNAAAGAPAAPPSGSAGAASAGGTPGNAGAAPFAAAPPAIVTPGSAAPNSAASTATPPALPPSAATVTTGQTVAGMPPIIEPGNVYSEVRGPALAPVVRNDLPRIYVPNLRSDDVYVIDPSTYKVVDRFPVGRSPQHVVPSWDLRTLWVTNNAEGKPDGSLTPIDPLTGKPGEAVPVDDPYNMYFTPDGRSAIVVAEAHKRLDFRDPQTMELQFSLDVPECRGINHADYSADGRYALFTCEFGGMMAKIDVMNRKVLGYLKLSKGGMPQDVRVAPDGRTFYVADMMADGVFVIDGDRFVETGYVPTGLGTHGLYPSRDGTKLYIANRGTHRVHGRRNGPGSVSVLDFATGKVVANWPVPGGGSPDMGNVSVDGKTLWLSGRFDDEVYAFDTTTGAVRKIRVGMEPHGLAVWPLPGRYSLGHTGILR